MENTYVEFKNVSFRYREELPWVLKNVSFTIKADEWVAVIGHNGSGKSTIAKLMNGLLFPERGEVFIGGEQVSEESIWRIRKKVGMVFQNPDNQFVGTTIRDDIAFGLENRGVPRLEMLERIRDSLHAVKMQGYELHEPHHLSGGQKQRVAIAGVLAVSPKIIILDEATVMLDPKGRQEILKTVREVRNNHDLALVTITHDLNEVTKADRVLVMNQGEVWQEASPREVFKRKEELQAIGLDIPFVAKLADELQLLDFPLKKEPLTHEELLEELWTFHLKR